MWSSSEKTRGMWTAERGNLDRGFGPRDSAILDGPSEKRDGSMVDDGEVLQEVKV
jgi:hypothetical protein